MGNFNVQYNICDVGNIKLQKNRKKQKTDDSSSTQTKSKGESNNVTNNDDEGKVKKKSEYHKFFSEKYPLIKEKYPGRTLGQYSKIISEEWSAQKEKNK